MVLYKNCAIHAPGVEFGHSPGVDTLHRLSTGKPSNINVSKGSRQISVKFHTQYHLAEGKLAYSFWANRTGTLVAMAAYKTVRFKGGGNIKNLLL